MSTNKTAGFIPLPVQEHCIFALPGANRDVDGRLLPEDKTTSIATVFPSLLSFRRKCKGTKYKEGKSFSSNED